MKTILITPLCTGRTNTFRAYSIAEALEKRGFDIHISIHSAYDYLFKDKNWTLHPLPEPEIHEVKAKSRTWDMGWYSEELVDTSIQQELELYHSVKPDAAISVFRFTTRLSARKACIPMYSVNNADFTPLFRHPLSKELLYDLLALRGLGFGELLRRTSNTELIAKTTQAFLQRENGRLLHPFSKYLTDLQLDLDSYYELLEGDVNFILDINELMPLADASEKYLYTGPIFFDTPHVPLKLPANLGKNVLICSDCNQDPGFIERVLTKIDVQANNVIIAGADVACCRAFSGCTFHHLISFSQLSQFDLIVSSGSRDTYYYSLKTGIPHVIFPVQSDHKVFADILASKGLTVHERDIQDCSFEEILTKSASLLPAIEKMRCLLPERKSEDVIADHIFKDLS